MIELPTLSPMSHDNVCPEHILITPGRKSEVSGSYKHKSTYTKKTECPVRWTCGERVYEEKSIIDLANKLKVTSTWCQRALARGLSICGGRIEKI